MYAWLAMAYSGAVALLLLFCGPIAWMLLQSVKGMNDIILRPYDLVPGHISLAAFSVALKGDPGSSVRLVRSFVNSAIYAGGSVVTNVLIGVPAGYAFARLRFPLRRLLFALVLSAMMVPTAAIIIPLYMVVRSLSLDGGAMGNLNSYQGMILPSAVTGLTILLVRQFLRGIPRDLDEAAALDGCGPVSILVHVILPLSGTAIATVATFTFLVRWDDYLWPSVVVVTPDMFTLQVSLRFLEANYSQQWPLLMASCALTALPVLLFYVALQPLFDSGLARLGSGWEP